MATLLRLLQCLLPASWRASIARDLDDEARAQARSAIWTAWQTLRIGVKLRITFGLGALWFDFRFAVRSLVRARWFTVGAALTFALGVGSNLTVFAAIDQLLFRPLPYEKPSELVMLRACDRGGGCSMGLPDVVADEARGGLSTLGELTLVDLPSEWTTEEPTTGSLVLTHAWPNLLRVLGATPFMGRDVTPDEIRTRQVVVLIGHETWTGRFGRDPGVLGRVVRRGDIRAPIVGVLPEGFVMPQWPHDARWEGVALTTQPMVIAPIARLRPGQTRDAAQREIDALVTTLGPRIRDPRDPPDRPLPYVRVDRVEAALFDHYTDYGWLIAAAAAVVLAMACVNLTALVLARGRSREQDAAMRTALGASRSRLVSAAVIETGLLCLLGTAVAFAAVAWTTDAIATLLPPLIARYAAGANDPRVLVAALIVSFAGSLVAGLWPGVRLAHANLAERLPRSLGAGRRQRLPGGRGLVVVETALGVVLVTGAALAGRSFVALATEDLGYDSRDWYLVGAVPLGGARAGEKPPAVVLAEYEQTLDIVRTTPGVAGVAGGDSVLMTSGGPGTYGFSSHRAYRGSRHEVSAGFFGVSGAKLVAGREFTDEEVRARALVGILDPAGLAQVWPGMSPDAAIGRLLILPDEPPRTIVGIAPRLIRNRRGEDVRPSLFVPLGTRPRAYSAFMVRTAPGQPPPLEAIRARLGTAIGPRRVTAYSVEQALQPALKEPRFRAILFGAFAACALLLAVAGLYAIVSFDASLRRHEVGVRMTLGATARGIVGMVLAGALKPVVAGVAIGIAIATWASQFLEAYLYQVDRHDPWTMGAVAGTLIGAGVLAAWVPARRAARTDPAVVLRST